MDGYGKRVLIIEDEEDAGNLLIRVLEKAGYNVYVALDGRQALEEMKKRRFDMVISDHHMPKINGLLALLGRLVSPDTSMIQLPMILLSDDDTSVAEMAEQGGACSCLRKPYDVAELLILLRNAILSTQEYQSHTPISGSLPAYQ